MYLEDRQKALEKELEELKSRIALLESKGLDRFVTPKELAAIMQCSPNTVYVKIRSGEIVADRSLGNPRIPMSQFDHLKKCALADLGGSCRKGKWELTVKERIFGSN